MHRGVARTWLLLGFVLSALVGAAPVAATTGAVTTVPESVRSSIEQYVQQEVGALDLPGASVTVVDGSGGSWSAAFGRAGEGRRMTPATPVLLASTSKSITALAVAQLVEADVLDLDVPVAEYLPWFDIDGPAARSQAASGITARHLLAHTSGIPKTADVGGVLGGHDGPGALEQHVRDITGVRLVAGPGDRFEYANANYDILGLLVQELSGRSFGEYVQDEVFVPLGMDDSYATAVAADRGGVATGYYRWFGAWWRPTSMPRPVHSAPSATMFASSEDLGRLVSAHLARPEEVVSERAWGLLHARAADVAPDGSYAGGWYVHDLFLVRDGGSTAGGDPQPVPTVWEHSGSYPNSMTFAAFVPELDRGVAFVVNGNDQAVVSRLLGINANLLRLLGGQEPVPVIVREPPLRTYGWAVAAVLLIAELVSLVWSVRVIARWHRGERPPVRRRLVTAAVLLVLDLVVVGFAVVYVPQRFVTSVPEMARLAPDIAVSLLPALAIAVVWGLVRTLLLAAVSGMARRSTHAASTDPMPNSVH